MTMTMISGKCRLSNPPSAKELRVGLWDDRDGRRVKDFNFGDQYTCSYDPNKHGIGFLMTEQKVAKMCHGKATVSKEKGSARRLAVPGWRPSYTFKAITTRFEWYPDENRLLVYLPEQLEVVSDGTRGAAIGNRRVEVAEMRKTIKATKDARPTNRRTTAHMAEHHSVVAVVIKSLLPRYVQVHNVVQDDLSIAIAEVLERGFQFDIGRKGDDDDEEG